MNPKKSAGSPRRLELRLLGPPELLADGTPILVERRKALALLAYLALEPGEHSRDALATLLAPDDDQASARAGLRRALAVLTPFARPWLHTGADRIGLRHDPALIFDVDRFRAGLAGDQAELREAVALYRGDLLAGFSLPGSPAFDEWQFLQAEELRRELAGALERLSRPELAPADLEAAIGYARRWLALDPLHEPAHRRLMLLYAAAGQQSATIRQYRLLSETLERELGAAPEPATVDLYEQLRLGDRSGQGSRWSTAPPRLPAAPAPPGPSIEASALPFLGREAELARIAAALADPACRILTLIGPGGMGKTRLAIQSVADNRPLFPDGVYQISLVGVSSAERMLTTIGAALGVAGQGDQPERIGAILGERRVLLLLDNADQTLEGAPLLRALTHRAPNLKILVTSRERLQLAEEWVIDLAGLEVPAEDEQSAAEYSAVRLFAQRARQVRADFILNEEDLPHVVEICRLVEGMPLAIELAAAWVRVLTPAEIAQELAQNMALLTTSLLDVPERHRSVEGVFAQSWERLTPAERAALCRLSVFEDGFTRAGAAEVAGATPLILAGLADKALIRRDRTGRYAIHELLRQFAARRLAADPEGQQAAMLRFCRFYMSLLERRTADLLGAHQRQAFAELDAEYDNLWDAWAWAAAEGLLEELSAGLDGLYRLHELRGWYSDGIQALGLLVDRMEGVQSSEGELLRARALARLGALSCWVGQFALAENQLAAALPVLQTRQADLDAAFARTGMGMVALERDDDARAHELLRAGLTAYQSLGYKPGVAWAIDALGDLAGSRGEYALARELLNESSAIYTALGDQVNAAWSLSSLGRVLGLMGEHAAARQLLAESLELFEAIGEQHGAATAHANLGELALASRDLAAAGEHWRMALRLAREAGALPLVIDAIVGLAMLLAESGANEEAHELAALALAQPAAWQETLSAAQTLFEQTAAALARPIAEQAARRGRATPWESATARLLVEG